MTHCKRIEAHFRHSIRFLFAFFIEKRKKGAFCKMRIDKNVEIHTFACFVAMFYAIIDYVNDKHFELCVCSMELERKNMRPVRMQEGKYGNSYGNGCLWSDR